MACSRCGVELEGKEGLCAACWRERRNARVASAAAAWGPPVKTPTSLALAAVFSGIPLALYPFILIADVMSFAAARGELSSCVTSPFGFFVCYSLAYPLALGAAAAAYVLLQRRRRRRPSAWLAFLPGAILVLSFIAAVLSG